MLSKGSSASITVALRPYLRVLLFVRTCVGRHDSRKLRFNVDPVGYRERGKVNPEDAELR
jgi:hypothetical protein